MAKMYDFVGYGIENPSLQDIEDIADRNMNSGSGEDRKRKISKFPNNFFTQKTMMQDPKTQKLHLTGYTEEQKIQDLLQVT